MNVPYARVDCSGNELLYIKEVLESGWLTTASKAQELEFRFASHIGVQHALAVNSCTSGLHLALEALGIKAGDKVLLPSMTFTATAEVIRYLQAEPVLMDVDPTTSLVSVEIATNALRKHPDAKAMMIVHYGGQAAEMDDGSGGGISALCKAQGVAVVEDAAHAFPTRLNGTYVGNFGDVTCFSFYANKTMTTGEGGMVVTNSNALAERMRIMRLHGFDRPVWERYTGRRNMWEYDVVAPGFKYNMPDLNAAVGLAQLERAEANRVIRRDIATAYTEAFSDHPGLSIMRRTCGVDEHSWHLFPVLVSEDLSVSRNTFIEALATSGVGVSVHYKPLHQLTYYKEAFQFRAENYPGAESLWLSTVSLPIYSSMTIEEINHVVGCVSELATRYS
jgi:dTDP-4-amino-4,6-dideoxygalactose transaminase